MKLEAEGKIEPIILLLAGLMAFFTVAVFIAEWRFGNDGQMFQVVSNVLSGIVGAFIMRVKPSSSDSSKSTEEIKEGLATKEIPS